MKLKTLEEVERMKEKAARFVRDVLGDDDRAEEIEDESPESYADRKRVEIIDNPERKNAPMAQPTKQELMELLDQVGDKVGDLLDPILSREQIVEGLQELDEMINGEEESEEEDDSEEYDEGDDEPE